jgi:hypothetical protein
MSSEEQAGLEHRYFVYKAVPDPCGCRSAGECSHGIFGPRMKPGPAVENCFVLRPDKDFAALAALRHYASATTNEALRRDLIAWADRVEAAMRRSVAVGPERGIVFADQVEGQPGRFLVTLDCGHKKFTSEQKTSYPCRECSAARKEGAS